MLFLPQSLIIWIDLEMLGPQSWKTECGNSDFAFVDSKIIRDQLNVHKQ